MSPLRGRRPRRSPCETRAVESSGVIALIVVAVVAGCSYWVFRDARARVERRRPVVAVVFGLAAMAGAYTGGRLARFIPGTVLLIAFAVIMIAAGAAMLRGRKEPSVFEGAQRLPVLRITMLGLSIGVISGLVGAGGGFLLVPALALLAGLPMPLAVGTSLVVISMQSFAGFAGHLATEHIDWRLAAMVTAAAVVGALIGGRLIAFIDPTTLRKLFGWFVLLMASLILAQEVHPALGAAAAALTVISAGLSIACSRWGHCPLRRLLGQSLTAAVG